MQSDSMAQRASRPLPTFPMAGVARPVGWIRAGIFGFSVVMRLELAAQLRQTISGNTTPQPMNGHLWGETQMHVLGSTRRLADTTGQVSMVRRAWLERIISLADVLTLSVGQTAAVISGSSEAPGKIQLAQVAAAISTTFGNSTL